MGSGVLITASYKAGYLNKQDMLDIFRFRPIQAEEILGNEAWAGYQIAFNGLASTKHQKALYDLITKHWMRYIRHKLGKGRFSLRGKIIHNILRIAGISTYYMNKVKADSVIKYYEGRSLWSIYKPIFREVEGRA